MCKYDKKLGGLSQITEFNITNNSENNCTIRFDISSCNQEKCKYHFKVLHKNEAIVIGEDFAPDLSLGEYILEILFVDTRIQPTLLKELTLETNYVSINAYLNSFRIAFPPDDSSMVFYLGFSYIPHTKIIQDDDNSVIFNIGRVTI